jgi:adenylosuccinate synthase
MSVDVLLGLQWGDEGKGKIVDYLAPEYDMVARFQGGPNAGHTLKIEGKKYVLHTVPSGIFRENMLNLIGNGVVLDPITFSKEIAMLKSSGIQFENRLMIAKKAHLILPTHRLLDAASEQTKGKFKIGSTLKGIGPTYMDKTGRNGLRIGDILSPDFLDKYQSLKQKHLNLLERFDHVEFDLEGEEQKWWHSLDALKSLQLVDGEYFVNQVLTEGKNILAEGAQGSMLDIDFGTYPYVTSSSTITAGVCTGLGVSPSKIREVIGISKAYCTRVGSGPFPTELFDGTGKRLQEIGNEFGATTGRPRRCGWIDIPQLKYSIMLNGVTKIVLTKLDVLNDFEQIGVATAYQIDQNRTDQLPFNLSESPISPIYEYFKGWSTPIDQATSRFDLPIQAKAYVDQLENLLGTKIFMISTGPGREELIVD